jgi:pimeloyl-ACP methyl ester carboxylesterase
MQFFRASDGARLAFSDAGNGARALVFVHGWQADGSVWRDLRAALGPGVRSITVDLRGSGASAAAPGPYRLERFAADLRELIEALGIAPVVLVGHSMGATAALALAVDAPQLVGGLVLIAPVPAGGAGFSPKGAAYLQATAGDEAAAKAWLARTFAKEPDPAVLARLCAAAARTPRAAALESFQSWAYAGFADATKSIQAPVLVLAPALDVPETAQQKVAALLQNARYEVMPDCAHYAIVERPEAIAELIRAFVADL